MHVVAVNEFVNTQALLADGVQKGRGIALDDSSGGVAAGGSITVNGSATASGTLTLWVGYQYLEILVTTGDTANIIAAAINMAINAAYSLPETLPSRPRSRAASRTLKGVVMPMMMQAGP